MNYKSCYESRSSNSIGGVFISANGSCRVIPDHYLNSMKLQNDSTLLRFCYSSCVIDISGYRLDSIYNDATIGKLGVIKVARPADDRKAADAKNSPFVTNIIHVPMPSVEAFDLESKDA